MFSLLFPIVISCFYPDQKYSILSDIMWVAGSLGYDTSVSLVFQNNTE